MLESAFDGVVEGTYATVESIGWQDMGLFKHMYQRAVRNGRREKNMKAVWGEVGFVRCQSEAVSKETSLPVPPRIEDEAHRCGVDFQVRAKKEGF
jgi:hypothetical protein